MKVWEVRLSLCFNSEESWVTRFDVKSDGCDYELINGYYRKITKSWFREEIPVSVQVKRIAGAYQAIKGFDHEPSEDELNKTKEEMKEILFLHLQREQQEFITDYSNRFKAIGGVCVDDKVQTEV